MRTNLAIAATMLATAMASDAVAEPEITCRAAAERIVAVLTEHAPEGSEFAEKVAENREQAIETQASRMAEANPEGCALVLVMSDEALAAFARATLAAND